MDKQKNTIKIEGMSCSNCANGIKKHLERNGVKGVNVSFSMGEASYNDQNQNKDSIIKLITDLGYKILDEKQTQKFKHYWDCWARTNWRFVRTRSSKARLSSPWPCTSSNNCPKGKRKGTCPQD